MPLRPEYQNPIDMDDFFDQLSSLKNQNLENLRNSTVEAPNQPVMPKEKNPNAMEEFKAELDANKQIAAEQKSNWGSWKTKRDIEKATPVILGGLLIYYLFF